MQSTFQMDSNFTVTRKVSLNYYLFDYWDTIGDPRNRHYPLMSGGPWTVLSIILSYLVFVTHVGPEIMKKRPPFQLRKIMFVYNTFMVILNGYFFYESLVCLNYGLDCFNFVFPSHDDLSPLARRRLSVGYLYIVSKLLDLTDTVFIVLRKKHNQITRLHLYHHSLMPLLGWLAGLLCPTSGPCGLFPLINSIVHIVMYSYYGLSSLGTHMRRYLWWKKYITITQLAQFAIYFFYSILFLKYQNGYPTVFFYVCAFPQPIVFFMLFMTFYQKSYEKMK